MTAGAIICYTIAIGAILFLPTLHASGGLNAPMLELLQAGQAGDMWFGAVLLALAVLGIILSAIKKKNTVRISAAAGCAAFAVGLVSLATSGITTETLGADIFVLLLPLLFAWSAVCNGMYLFLIKKQECDASCGHKGK